MRRSKPRRHFGGGEDVAGADGGHVDDWHRQHRGGTDHSFATRESLTPWAMERHRLSLRHGTLSRERFFRHMSAAAFHFLLCDGLRRCRVAHARQCRRRFGLRYVRSCAQIKKWLQRRSQVMGGNSGRESREGIPGGTSVAHESGVIAELVNIPEFRGRRAGYRHCEYWPPPRQAASDRWWPQGGRRRCWRAEGRGQQSWT